MDDFKRPEQQNNEPQPPMDEPGTQFEERETYVTPEGEPTTVTPVAPVTQVKEKKPSKAGKWVLWGVVVLVLAGLGALAYWQYTEAQSAKAEVESLKTTLSAAQDANKDDDKDKDEAKAEDTPLTAEESAKLSALAYYCGLADFGCDKVTTTVVKSVPHSMASAGYFVLEAKASAGKVQKLYLKSVDNVQWAVFYAGNTPMDETTKQKFAVPDSIAKA